MITLNNFQYCADITPEEMQSMRGKRMTLVKQGNRIEGYVAEVHPEKGLTCLSYKDQDFTIDGYTHQIKAGDEIICLNLASHEDIPQSVHNQHSLQAHLKQIKWFSEVISGTVHYTRRGHRKFNKLPSNMSSCAFL